MGDRCRRWALSKPAAAKVRLYGCPKSVVVAVIGDVLAPEGRDNGAEDVPTGGQPEQRTRDCRADHKGEFVHRRRTAARIAR